MMLCHDGVPHNFYKNHRVQGIGEIPLIIINKRDVRHTESSNIDENAAAGVTASRQKFSGSLSPI
jgi:hypothetical protein